MLKGLIKAMLALASVAIVLLALVSVLSILCLLIPAAIGTLGLVLMPFRVLGSLAMIVAPVVVIGLFVWLMLVAGRALAGPAKDERDERDDSRLLQEVHRGLARLDDRVEALETIMLAERHRGAAPDRRTSGRGRVHV
jgi:phage shock protein B